MNAPFLFAFAILLASSNARYKPKIEVYEIRGNDNTDKIQINDVINDSGDKLDSALSRLLQPFIKEKDESTKPKHHKLAKIVDALIYKLKRLSASSNEHPVYNIKGNLVVDEEDGFDNNVVDETKSVPIIVNRKDILYELLGQPAHRLKRPILRIEDDDRTAPPPHRYVYDSDGSY